MVLALFIERKKEKECCAEAFLFVDAADATPVDRTTRRAILLRRNSNALELIIITISRTPNSCCWYDLFELSEWKSVFLRHPPDEERWMAFGIGKKDLGK